MNEKELFQKAKKLEMLIKKRVSTLLLGSYDSAFHGHGLEFMEVREYTPGDDVRHIDWNVTARAGIPYIKTFKEERELQIHIVIDVSESCYVEFNGKPKIETMAELASLITIVAQLNNDRVGLLLFSDRIENYIPPKKGRTHCQKILKEILGVSPMSLMTDIKMALDTLSKFINRGDIIFVLSDFYDSKYENSLKKLGSNNDLIAIRLISPIEKQLPSGFILPLVESETGKYREIYTTETKENISNGYKDINEIIINEYDDYFDSLYVFFNQRNKINYG
ncbi:DUF58 domain-containing protein [Spirochaeta cellobiosiphila]|uniref:DUF58 domain-containing protein n=1 Tax=Spirochaeta cellobiosiphila TaxID=504483 RepID=UPI0004245AE8|nr:DUF58 domain-containing protein [Spirochaeta cellobiosiphila]